MAKETNPSVDVKKQEKRVPKADFKQKEWLLSINEDFDKIFTKSTTESSKLYDDLLKLQAKISDPETIYKDPNGVNTLDEDYKKALQSVIDKLGYLINNNQELIVETPERAESKTDKQDEGTKTRAKKITKKRAAKTTPKKKEDEGIEAKKESIEETTKETRVKKPTTRKTLRDLNSLETDDVIEAETISDYDSKIRQLLKNIKENNGDFINNFIETENTLLENFHDFIKNKQKEDINNIENVNSFINEHLTILREINGKLYKLTNIVIEKEKIDQIKEILNRHLSRLVELRDNKYRTFYPKITIDEYISDENREIFTNYPDKDKLNTAIKAYVTSIKNLEPEESIEELYSAIEREAEKFLLYEDKQREEAEKNNTQHTTKTKTATEPSPTNTRPETIKNRTEEVEKRQKKIKGPKRISDYELDGDERDEVERHISASRRPEATTKEQELPKNETNPDTKTQNQRQIGGIIKNTNFNISPEQLNNSGITLNLGKGFSFSSAEVTPGTKTTTQVEQNNPQINPENSINNRTEEIKIPIEDLLIFENDDVERYENMMDDNGFNTWFEKLFKQLEKRGQNTQSEAQSISVWVDLYEKFKPHMNVLNKVIEDIRSNTTERTKLIIAENYIGDLIYYAYDNRNNPAINEALKQIIDKIKTNFEKTQNNKKIIEDLKKQKAVVDNNTDEKGKIKEIRSDDQVKNILETRGEENDKETFDDLLSFLHDMYYNYEYYSGGINHESDTNAIYSIANRYESNSSKNKGIELGLFGKAFSFIKSIRPFHEVKADSINKLKPLIQRLQKLNLVSKKDASDTTNRENSIRMEQLLFLMNEHKYVLLNNLKTTDTELQSLGFDEEGVRLVKTFRELFDLYESTKYKTEKSKSLAEKMLSDAPRDLDQKIEEISDETDSLDALLSFEDDYVLDSLEKEAEYEIAKEDLKNLDEEINRLGTGNRAVSFENLKRLGSKYTELAQKLEESSDLFTEEVSLSLKKTELKLNELIIKKINKNDFSQLSEAFKHYDAIVINPSIEKDTKKQYLRELIDKLNTQSNTRMTALKKATLSAIISKYTDILNKIDTV